VKVGDLVKLMNVPAWTETGTVALVTRIIKTEYGTGQIYLMVNGIPSAIPWASRHSFIMGVVSESR
jgi:hypothetical protein